MKGSQAEKHNNYCIYHGTKPEKGVEATTVMVNDIFHLLKQFNRKTLTTVLPDALDLLVGSDADFEAILSSTA